MTSLKSLIAGGNPVFAPNVFNALTAKIAEQAGFNGLYLGGGPLGYLNCGLEANLTLQDLVHVGIEVRTVSALPLVLDGLCGWGDPMHMHRSIPMAEAAGFSAIEIEDQILPKRAHHHIQIEHMIPAELMAAKIREAVAARRSTEFLIIGRSNGIRASNMDDALRRAELYKKAGADILFLLPRTPEEIRFVGERLEPPLMYMSSGGGLEASGLTPTELFNLGYRLLVVPMVPVLAFHRVMQETYRAIADGVLPASLKNGGVKAEHEALNDTVGLPALLEIERQTVERE
jgi:methylisocitrate lyase